MLGQAVEGMPWLGTFHSIGGRILRIHAELVGLKSNFTVLDTDDQIRLLKQLSAGREHRREALAGADAGGPDRWLEEPRADAAASAAGRSRQLSPTARAASSTRIYQERLKTLNAADFGDLLLENIRLFREHPDVLRQYQHRFKFILVDEYQDTNVAQYLWLRLLAQAPSPRTRRRDRLFRAAMPSPPAAKRRRNCRVQRHRTQLLSSDLRAPQGRERMPAPRRTTEKHLLRRRRRPVDLWLARRRGRQHPALRSRLSRRQGHPARAQLSLDRPHPRRGLASDRAQ